MTAPLLPKTNLYDFLMQGPDLTNSIVGVLTRFRKEGVVADVEVMYHQVRISTPDMDALRFF